MSDRLYSDPGFYVRVQKFKIAIALAPLGISSFSGSMDPLLAILT